MPVQLYPFTCGFLTIPRGLGLAEEVAAGILWLASDESSYVTGTELVIDGARSIG